MGRELEALLVYLEDNTLFTIVALLDEMSAQIVPDEAGDFHLLLPLVADKVMNVNANSCA